MINKEAMMDQATREKMLRKAGITLGKGDVTPSVDEGESLKKRQAEMTRRFSGK